jgi:hypothetical protein
MGFKKRNNELEDKIMSHPVTVLNWTSDVNCVPCKNQDRDLAEIGDVVDSDAVGIVNLNFQKNRREFSKLGNKLLPSINVFVRGKQMNFIDTKLRLPGQKGYKSKPVKSLAGARSKNTLAHVIRSALEKL